MPVYRGIGKLLLEVGHKCNECRLLRFGACVLGRLAVCGKSPNVANADRGSVLPLAMRSDFGNGSAGVDCAVKIDNEVVADATEAPLTMPTVYVLDGERLALGCGGAMDDKLVNFSHGLGIWVSYVLWVARCICSDNLCRTMRPQM